MTNRYCSKPIVDNVKITVPNSIEQLTPYILEEQQDWFEDEIRFLRNYLRPDMNIIDIGANYGVYTLSAAKIVGEKGHVWAFEPTQEVCNCLRESISANNFQNVTLLEAGLSNRSGTAQLGIIPNAVGNTMHVTDTFTGHFEEIKLLSLDDFMEENSLPEIDFIKLDAEGEEINILEGATSFLKDHSPLIMFELIHERIINSELINTFQDLGFKLYRLLPELDVLVPFDPDYHFDSYFFLNIFACRDTVATSLEEQGFLVKRMDFTNTPSPELLKNEWETYLNDKPFYTMFSQEWQLFYSKPLDTEYWQMLEKIGYTLNTKNPISLRVNQAFAVREELLSVIEEKKSFPVMATLIRVHRMLGFRADATFLFDFLIENLSLLKAEKLYIPFIPVDQKYEILYRENESLSWFISSLLEGLEKCHNFSSYLTGTKTVDSLKLLQKLGFASEEMKRRLALIEQRIAFHKQTK